MHAALLAALLCAAAPAPAGDPAPAPYMPAEEQLRAVRSAWIAERLGDVATARRLFAQAGATWPDDPFLLDETLRFLDRRGEDPAVLASLRARLTGALSDPARPLPIPLVRRQVLDRGTPREDLDLLRRTVSARLDISPSDPELLSLLADAQRRLQDGPGLAATLARLADVRPSHELTWERLFLAVHLGRWPEAKALLDAIEAAGDDASAIWRIRLSVLAHLQDADAVLAAIREPKDVEERGMLVRALEQIAWDLWDSGRAPEAEAVFRKALALAPDDRHVGPIVAHLFADSEERAARARVAEASWDKVDDPDALLQEGSTRLVAGDAAGAYPLLLRASTALPKEPTAWYNLGLSAKKLERWAEATRALERAVELRSEWAPAWRALADAQAKGGACPGALVAARRAAELDPTHLDSYVTLFQCHQELGDHAAAAAARAEYDRRKAGGR